MIGLIVGLAIGFVLTVGGLTPSMNAFISMQEGKVTEFENKKYICQVIEEKGWIPKDDLRDGGGR